MLFCDRKLFYRLSKGMNLPQNIDEILSLTAERLGEGFIDYEDCAPALYLKLSLEGTDMFSSIRQVVVDEAQDYYPMHYEVLRLMFRDSAFTVLGDVNQSVERHSSQSIYSSAARILGRKKSLSLSLTKSYRSSVEINRFAGRLLKDAPEAIPFERHEEEPSLICCTSLESMDSSIIRDINAYRDHGYKSMAVLCKTLSQTIEAFSRLKDRVDISLVDSGGSEIGPGAVIIPSYLAKGLEFDTVLLYDVSKESYDTDFDRRLLYISCTRALHRLSLYYTGEKSRFI
jgi:DNA helicase-2/ATP-dependent DNA helicase PcrA